MSTDAKEQYEKYKSESLALDITRGQPSTAQFDLSNDLLTNLSLADVHLDSGLDCRNYGGGVAGLDSARELFAPLLEVDPELVIVGENSSLALMGRVLSWALLAGVPGGTMPWRENKKVKFLCPVPGYDRHFTMLETLGIEMIAIENKEGAINTEKIAELVTRDEEIKGMWIVPKYSNPTGLTLSKAEVVALAELTPKAPDFRIFADNAYSVHHLYRDKRDTLTDMYQTFLDAGCEERLYLFGSSSKITFAGGGLGFLAASPNNRDHLLNLFGTHTIGPNKIEQLRHVHFFKERSIEEHMSRHADIIRPKFDVAYQILERELAGTELASWTKPLGGYFISLDTAPGLASKTVELAKNIGVKLTPAGATYPYKQDPQDCNIRIAPTRPVVQEVEKAIEVLTCCIKLAEQGA